MMGIEPTYPAWKAGALADVLHPQNVGWIGVLLLKLVTASLIQLACIREVYFHLLPHEICNLISNKAPSGT